MGFESLTDGNRSERKFFFSDANERKLWVQIYNIDLTFRLYSHSNHLLAI